MLAGFVFHNLAMFPQSYPRPDLTHLPPEKVYECGELWALAPGAARLVRHAGYILAGLRRAQAIVAYALLKPRDTSALYKTFTRVGPPIEWHYVRGIDGSRAWTQAMVLQGAALEMTVNVATALSFESFDGQNLQFRNVVSNRAQDRQESSYARAEHRGSGNPQQSRPATAPLATACARASANRSQLHHRPKTASAPRARGSQAAAR